MRAVGNGDPAVCADNLLKLTRGEVPYERVKGIDPRIIDRPCVEAEPAAQRNAEWLIETYEPRVIVSAINVAPSDTRCGGFVVTADIEKKE